MQAPDDEPVRPATSRPGTVADAGSGPSSTGGQVAVVSTGGTGGTSAAATGGAPATGGTSATGGANATGGTTATGGTAGTAGAPGHACPAGGTLDCSSTGALHMTDGHVTDFSSLDWDAATGQFCGAGGLRGRLFSFGGPASSTGAATVDTAAHDLKLNVKATSWGGGGVIFESCVNAAGFTSVQFTARLSAGSLSGCTWQVQLQTQDQRGASDTDPTGGTCSGNNCYAYPAVVLAPPGGTPTTYTKTFTAFNNQSGSKVPLDTQIVGVQWQVTSASPQGCSAELRIDDIAFR